MSPATSNRPERPRDAEEAAPAPPAGGARARPAEVESSRVRPAPIDVAVCDKSPLILAGLEKLMEDDGRFRLVTMPSPSSGPFSRRSVSKRQ